MLVPFESICCVSFMPCDESSDGKVTWARTTRVHTHTHTHTHTDRHAWPFIHAVDWKELKIPEYPFVVSIPMDLSKVESRLFDGFYPNAHTFARDVRLTFQNALTFNAPEDEVGARVHRIGEILER